MIAVHADTGHVVRRSAGVDLVRGLALGDVGVDRKKVVLAEEHDWEFLQRRKIHRFVPDAFFSRGITMESDGHFVLVAQLNRQRRADGLWDGAADQRRRTQQTNFGCAQLH